MCPYFKWVLLLTKPCRPPPFKTPIPFLSPDQREDGELRQTPIIRPSFTILHLPPQSLLATALILVRIFLPKPLGTGGGEVKDSTVQLSFGIRTEGMIHKRRPAPLLPMLDIICMMDRGRKLSVCCVFTLELPINSEFLCEWIAGTGPGLMDKQCSGA